ncbi:hypothetical protein CJD36_005775 [Flavipsychrobacter stenotrophus]|uniref:histidine kinase n=1 Tax=Flavipsychrobacter stenotrophus TaxID=2077091 RepID=A0A2S7SWK4_9BACT|nr:tetratricopeptide repeat protein [Flavipsychrobacter stenotrophus]PQJ11309.1 hypothetical protein CJD36_005775 [Flavipsychrobacter stenotrophus]
MKTDKTDILDQPKQLGYISTAATAILIFCISIATHSFAGNIDSLNKILNGKKIADPERVTLTAQLAHAYRDANLDSMMIFANRGIALAKQIHFDQGKAACLKELGTAYSSKNLYDSTLLCYNRALHIYEQINDINGQKETVFSMANIYSRQLKYAMAIEYYEKTIAFSKKMNDQDGIAVGMANTGSIYMELGNYPESIKYYLESSKVYEQQQNVTGLLTCLTGIANVYSLLGNNVKAEEYVIKSLSLQNGKSKSHETISFYVDIGAVYTTIKNFDKGLLFFKKALHLSDSIGDSYWRNICLADIAETYYNMGNLDSSFAIYTACVKNLETVYDIDVNTVVNTGLGKILIKQGKTKEGITYLLKSFDIARENRIKDEIVENAEELSKAYEQLSTYDKALLYRKIYEVYKDSLFNEKSEKHIQQLQFDYQLEKNKTIAHNKSVRQTTIILSLIAGLISFVVIIILLFRSRQVEKMNKEKSIILANEVKQQSIKLEELNTFKDKTFSVLSHDLRGPISGFTGTMAMLDKKQITQQEFDEIRPEINKQLDALNLLLENLLGWSKNHMQGGASVSALPVNMHTVANDNIDLFENTTNKKTITIVNNIPADLNAFADRGQVDIIFRNLLNNAIKFTGTNGTITLNGKISGSNTIVSITDTGVGMTTNQMDKLFGIATEKSTYGTDGEKGIGIGLILCYEFIKANKGDLTVTSTPGAGTTFNIILPSVK